MTPRDRVLHALTRRKSVTVTELAALNLSRASLYRQVKQLEQDGEIVRVRRGLYRAADSTASSTKSDSWVLVLQQYPKGVLCLLSALLFHGLTTQVPSVVWLALPKGARRQSATWPPIRPVYLSGAAYLQGIETHKRSEGSVRVYSVAKTVVDCFKFRNQVGVDVAMEALREGWQHKRFTLEQLDAMARVCRVQAVMRPYVEALIA